MEPVVPAHSQGVQISTNQPKDKKLNIMSCLLHAADISNPTKTQPVALKWTQRVLNEFWAQGDKQRNSGLPISPLCDRNGADVPGGQIGFIQYVINPYWSSVAKLITECHEAITNLKDNEAFWKEQKE